MTRVPPEIVTRVREAARRVGRDPHDLAHALDLSPAVVARALDGRPTVRVLTPVTVAGLRAAFGRRTTTARKWFEAQAAVHGVGHATVRRAVYGFGAYSRGTNG
ncbi:MAG: hypothetical protein U0804_28470 [Gemmataceae bacterium]